MPPLTHLALHLSGRYPQLPVRSWASHPTFPHRPGPLQPGDVYEQAARGQLKVPSQKELVPGLYREMQMLLRMKAWLKIGNLHGYLLNEQPGLEEANRQCAQMEEETLRLGPASLPGYFELEEE